MLSLRTLGAIGAAAMALAVQPALAAAQADTPAALWAASKASGPQGDTHDSVKALPKWEGGAWALDDASFMKTIQASSSVEPGNPNVPELTPKWRDYRLANGAANGGQGPEGGVPNNAAKCMPDGMPGIMVAPLMFEILFNPGRVTFINSNHEVRRIYTDGRPHGDPDPKFEGHSIGHWEGDTLVVHTNAILPKAEVFMGLPQDPGTEVIERIRLASPTKLSIETVVSNPKMFVKPYRYSRTYDHQPVISDDICFENNRDANGDIDLTPPPEE